MRQWLGVVFGFFLPLERKALLEGKVSSKKTKGASMPGQSDRISKATVEGILRRIRGKEGRR